MATLKLKKAAGPRNTPVKPARAPVRGAGTGVKKRPTLTEAQQERAEHEARYQEQRRLRWGESPPPTRPADGRAPPRPPRREETRRDDSQRNARHTSTAEPRRDVRGRPPARSSNGPALPYKGTRDDGRGAPAARHDPAAPQRPRAATAPPTGANTAFAGRRGAAPPQPARRDEGDGHWQPEHAEQPGSMRLSKRMSELGIASRREADEWIPKGWVRVDGKVVSELGSRVTPGQLITIDARVRDAQAMKVTVLINKPVGYVSGQAEDGYEPASVLVTPQNQWREDRSAIRFLPAHLRGLAPAGRLDIDSVGLLVLTQDGRIAKQLIGEDSEVEKEYLVRVQSESGQPLAEGGLALLRHGLSLDGEALRPAQVDWVNEDQLRFVLREGKKRQIRRMCEAVGLKVLGLKRVRIGLVMLGDLPVGAWRYLRGDERFIATAKPEG